ncbi:RGS domain-containing protein [Halteromyces radiatus]|uniref:RGS domain-containing protein n=1 Tax=Halteromyces radiatus TaxID=101107 RepID=UPI002220F281|nr:RGS domain-containing protein [Halteromyces radiatus]KAI8085993.1 RGS domain-containing protein [Halteromyces radiatus]
MALTLECLLKDPSSSRFQDFSRYLQQQYSTENLLFWLAVQQYKAAYDESNGKSMHQQCLVIIYTHIQPNAVCEINIPCDMRLAILDKVLLQGHIHPDLFLPASEAVLELMRENAFNPWLAQSNHTMVSSFSSPQGWSSHRPSVSSFRSTNDFGLPSKRRYPSLWKRMKNSFFRSASHRRSSLSCSSGNS